MGFLGRIGRAISKPFRRKKKRRKPKRAAPEEVEYIEPTEVEVEPPDLEGEGEIEDVTGTLPEGYRVVDYANTNGEWMNTDPVGKVTTDGSRMGQGDPPPTTEDIEASPWINVGFQDADGEWYYRWIQGPFDEEFWIDDAIEQLAHEYGISYGSAA